MAYSNPSLSRGKRMLQISLNSNTSKAKTQEVHVLPTYKLFKNEKVSTTNLKYSSSEDSHDSRKDSDFLPERKKSRLYSDKNVLKLRHNFSINQGRLNAIVIPASEHKAIPESPSKYILSDSCKSIPSGTSNQASSRRFTINNGRLNDISKPSTDPLEICSCDHELDWLSSYLAPAPRAVTNTYLAPTPPRATSTYLVSTSFPGPSTYQDPVPPNETSTYLAPAPPPITNNYFAPEPSPLLSIHPAPATPQVNGTYIPLAPPPVTSTYIPLPSLITSTHIPSAPPLVNSTYLAQAPPIVTNTYIPSASPLVTNTYFAQAPPLVTGTYIPSASPSASSTYLAQAHALVTGTYNPPASPSVTSTYLAQAQPLVTSTYTPLASLPVTSSYLAQAQPLVTSTYVNSTPSSVTSSYLAHAPPSVTNIYLAPTSTKRTYLDFDSQTNSSLVSSSLGSTVLASTHATNIYNASASTQSNHLLTVTGLPSSDISATVESVAISIEENKAIESAEESISADILKRAKKGSSDPAVWLKNNNQQLRMHGKPYMGLVHNDGHYKYAAKRSGKTLKPSSCTSKCKAPNPNKFCSKFTEDDRRSLFEAFWKMSWDQKEVYIVNLVKKCNVRDRTVCETEEKTYRKQTTYHYHLIKNNDRLQVCKNMFLSTFALGEKMVYRWVDRSKNGTTPGSTEKRKKSKNRESSTYLTARQFLDSLPKLPSHYCRSSSDKMYLEPVFTTFMSLYKEFASYCQREDHPVTNRKSFRQAFEDMNLSIFTPKKDQCDLCCSFETKNISEEVYAEHIQRKNDAREEKIKDKESIDASTAVITIDLQAVLLCPSLNASSLYYKTKLACHNFTIFDLGTKNTVCYFWHEGEGDLSANSFASCLCDYVINYLPSNVKTLIIYSDGCTYQNRNCILANSLLKLSFDRDIIIIQKILERGHTQMECDSVHSTFERQLRNKPIYTPSDYVRILQSARACPYEVRYLSHDFFKEYSSLRYYTSIRPGIRTGDPVVTNLRVLKYLPRGEILYKLNYKDEYRFLPRKSKLSSPSQNDEVERLFQEPLKIKCSKYQHLQELKTVIPRDYHAFYDRLSHD
ncbi:uncharacterized protein LOC130012503 [Patella vulgata]|uniref:uncharacterized protein LOC130012503 n=1 Tax=Patella vulgata TaxID=6465 RepID=UPI0024A93E50|nr:uncharacterized protein LOC130012503 [Patella vulgata]XP_055956577.1 uncharacterized protein LOC130012503 [Patella vulgata]